MTLLLISLHASGYLLLTVYYTELYDHHHQYILQQDLIYLNHIIQWTSPPEFGEFQYCGS